MDYDSEVEMDQEEGEEDLDSEESEGETLPEQEGVKPTQKRKKFKTASTFASYDEFAHLIEGDSDEDEKEKKHFK